MRTGVMCPNGIICQYVDRKQKHKHFVIQFQTRSDTDDGRGGVGLFINSNFTYVKGDDLSVFIPHVIESVFFEIQINERKTIIAGVVYQMLLTKLVR